MNERTAGLLFLCHALVACGASQASAPAPPAAAAEATRQTPATTGGEAAPAAPAAPSPREAAHREVIAAVACWFGGLWSDAEASAEASNEQARVEAAKLRCRALIRRLYARDGSDRVERLRSLEAIAVSELTDQIVTIAKRDEVDANRQDQLVALLKASASAARETMYARRDADKVKRSIAAGKPEAARANDESAAAELLAKDQALQALLELDARDLTHDARAIAILNAMDRMNVARGLPKRLKLITLRGPFARLLGVAAPGADTTKPLEGGVWLAYLKSVATAAGHPVSDKAKSLPQQERMAWGGAVMGLADRLQVEAAQLSEATELKAVTMATVRRLQATYRASEAETLKTPEAETPLADEAWP